MELKDIYNIKMEINRRTDKEQLKNNILLSMPNSTVSLIDNNIVIQSDISNDIINNIIHNAVKNWINIDNINPIYFYNLSPLSPFNNNYYILQI